MPMPLFWPTMACVLQQLLAVLPRYHYQKPLRVGLTGTKTISNAYVGGQIRMGTVWDPFGENSADLGPDWWQTLAHELAHYLLFLPDDYLGFKDEIALWHDQLSRQFHDIFFRSGVQ